MLKHFNDENFNQEVIEASQKKPILVDFYADWCAPCRMQTPIIEEVAKAVGEKAVIGKLNTEESANTAAKYKIMSIPSLLIFKNGEVIETLIGLQAKEKLIKTIKKHC